MVKRRMEEEQIVPSKFQHLGIEPRHMEVTHHEVVPHVPKRTNDGLDDIDFSPLKRRKCLDATQQNELDPIFYRIVGWLREQHTREALPKTVTKLSRAIAPMCRAVVQVDCTIVFYHLVFNRIILIEENADGSVTYSANPEPVRGSFVGYVPDDAPNVPFSDDFIMALERSTAWVLRYCFTFLSPHTAFLTLILAIAVWGTSKAQRACSQPCAKYAR
jgi:hypothetical protein